MEKGVLGTVCARGMFTSVNVKYNLNSINNMLFIHFGIWSDPVHTHLLISQDLILCVHEVCWDQEM